MRNENILSNNASFHLMQYRTGHEHCPVPNEDTPEGVEDMSKRLKTNGGYPQQDRMIHDKKYSFEKALLASYQSAFVKKLLDCGHGKKHKVRALINPNKTKQDYDDKIISIGYEHGYKPGDIFEWCNTGTYWIIYLQDLTELAYFRGDIRKCSYQIKWLNENNDLCSTYAAIRGPVETKINFIQKHLISIDTPNYSLDILMPKNEETLRYFKRYSKFYLTGLEDGDEKICWRVEATDSISMPGILEVVAVEYYANEQDDDMFNNLANGGIIEPIDPNENYEIFGETFIKPRTEYTYSTEPYGEAWSIEDTTAPVEIISSTDGNITIKWTANYSGQFNLIYGDYKKTIVVESLF